MQLPPSNRYRVPPETNSLRALAYANFTLAAISLLFHAFNAAVEGTQVDRQFEQALKVVENPQTQEMRKALQRTLDIKEGLRQHLAVRLPMSTWHGQADQFVELVTSLLLIASGVALLKRLPAAWALCLAYAAVSLGQKVGNLVYLNWFELPISQAYLASMMRMYPADAKLIQSILDPMTTGPMYQILFAAYPLLVAAVMLHPNTAEKLQPQELPASPPPPTPEPFVQGSGALLKPPTEAWTSFDNPSY
jgi:hypothetical protein